MGCSSDEADIASETSKGCIVLSLGGDDLYTEVETRTFQPLTDFTDYTFQLKNSATDEITTLTMTQVGSTNQLIGYAEAGTYDLIVDSNASDTYEGIGLPHLRGVSNEFTLVPASTVNVAVALTLCNAKLNVVLDNFFTSKYGSATFTVPANATSQVRTISLSSSGTDIYFPAGDISYTITAAALADSHVTDIAAAAGTVTLSAGYCSTLTLSANTLTGDIIPIVNGEHNSSFD